MDAMAATQRHATPTLALKLFKAPYAFEFDQAFRILENLNLTHERFGQAEDPRSEPLTVRLSLSSETPSCDIKAIRSFKDQWGRHEVTVNIMGLGGHHGPLPQPLSTILSDQERAHDMAPSDFVNIFNNRIASQWFRVRTKFRQGLSGVSPDQSTVGRVVIKLAGLESTYLQNQLSIPNQALIGCAPLLWQRPRSLVGLQQILNDHFDVDSHLTPMQGCWRPMPESQRSCVSGPYNTLGKTSYLGRHVWLQNAGFQIDFGVLTWGKYCHFLPPNSGFRALADMLKFYCGWQFRVILVLRLQMQTVPAVQLGRGYALGKTSWLKSYTSRIGTFRRILEYHNGAFTMI